MPRSKNNKWLPLLLSLSSGVLLWAAWPPHNLAFLLFLGLIPLFYLDHILSNQGAKQRAKFWYTFLGLFVFNILTTWWVAYASLGGAIFMLLFDTVLMSIPFWAFRKSKPIMGLRKALFAFVFYWLAIEYLHSHWQFSYPWLSLGNGFSTVPSWIQWYEYTGVAGGTLWVLGITVMIFYTFINPKMIRLISIACVITIPLILSSIIQKNLPEAYSEKEIVLLQPNVDPYEKFTGGNYRSQVEGFLELVKDSIGPNTELLVFPETALVEHINEDGINGNIAVKVLASFCEKHLGLKILTGASSHRFYKEGEPRAATARKTSSGHEYESYNTALLIGPDGVEQKYHKSKLVPGVEKMPYPKILGILDKLSINLGGISGSLASDKHPTVFGSDSFEYAPLICYESVFGDYTNQFVNQGADVLFVITNDGWWQDTDGHRQHKDYARLRAIENRREVLRSANTGISCRIDISGNVYQATAWWEPAVVKTVAKLYNKSTYYSKHGDGLGRVATVIAVLTLLSVLVKSYTVKKLRSND
jgi:apolipoprotein N-acyltransferase